MVAAMFEPRDYDDPLYKKWRQAVRRRDRFTCRMCGSKQALKCHHIRRWVDFPSLRFVVSNGITLCGVCHNRVTGQEEAYEAHLTGLVNSSARPKGLSKKNERDIRAELILRRLREKGAEGPASPNGGGEAGGSDATEV